MRGGSLFVLLKCVYQEFLEGRKFRKTKEANIQDSLIVGIYNIIPIEYIIF